MIIRIQFFSYFKDLTGCSTTTETLPEGSTVRDLRERLFVRYPKLAEMNRAMLIAVGVEYQTEDYVLREGDEVSFFPPVQGG